jgi:hypothetical protein
MIVPKRSSSSRSIREDCTLTIGLHNEDMGRVFDTIGWFFRNLIIGGRDTTAIDDRGVEPEDAEIVIRGGKRTLVPRTGRPERILDALGRPAAKEDDRL